jgi:hypothetical protein
MPNPCEYVEEFAEAIATPTIVLDVKYETTGASVDTPTDQAYGLELTSAADATSTLVADKSFDVVSSAAATSAAATGSNVDDALADSAAAAAAVTLERTLALTETADATGTPLYLVDTNVVSSAVASSTATLAPVRADEIEDGAAASDAVVIVRELNIVETANATAGVSVALVALETASAVASAAVVAAGAITLLAESTGQAAESVVTQWSTTVRCNSRGVATSEARPVDSAAPALWTNTENLAAAIWNQVPFDSYAMHDGLLLAAGEGGLYVFGANTDDGAQIAARVRGDLTDFGDAHKKRFDTAYLGGVAAGPMQLEVETEQGAYSYTSRQAPADVPTNHRFQLGRGLTGRYVRITLTNPNGVDFDAKDLQLVTGVSQRRIGG